MSEKSLLLRCGAISLVLLNGQGNRNRRLVSFTSALRQNKRIPMFRPILLLLLVASLPAAESPWTLADLKKPPETWDAVSPEAGVKAVWLAGPPYKGKPTRAFAYYGIPPDKTAVPGMVLLHGGGGTAF